MKRVVIESPYAGDVQRNTEYAKACVRDSLARGEAPYASHLFYTQSGILNDLAPSQRRQGIEAGFTWGDAAERRAVYVDLGISPGMILGVTRAKAAGQIVEFRSLYGADVSAYEQGEIK